MNLSENLNDDLCGSFPAGVITAGQLLCGGLFSNDRLSNWFSAVALAHGLIDQEDIKVYYITQSRNRIHAPAIRNSNLSPAKK